MLNPHVTKRCAAIPQLGTTLWHCNRCMAFIWIRSAKALDEPLCPTCYEAPLEFCGTLSSVPEIQFEDA
jgi:hypothetical protein